jgi:MFS family permease
MALLVGPLSIGVQTVGLFATPVSREFGWDRATYFLGPAVAALLVAAAFPFLGAAADRWGVKPVLAIGVTLYGCSLAAMGFMDGSLPLYVLLCIAVHVTGSVQAPPIYSKIVAGWFDRRRGLMIAVALCAMGVGGIFTPTYTRALMDAYGWRGAYVGLGLLILLIALPPILLLVREPARSSTGASAAPAASAHVGLNLVQAARTRIYWTLVGFYFFVSLALTGIVSNLVPMLVEGKVSMSAAVSAMSVIAISQTAGRLGSGYLLDRFRRPQISLVWFLGGAVGLLILLFDRTPFTATLAAALLGLAWGAEGETSGYFVSRYFGIRHLAAIAGSFFAAIAIASATSQLVMARLFDLTGAYQQPLIVAVISILGGCALIGTLPRYTYVSGHAGKLDEASPGRAEAVA